MFGEHAFTKGPKFFPLETTILTSKINIIAATSGLWAYYELLVANGHGEVPVECNTEVVGVIALVCDDMLQQRSLVSHDLC